MKFVFDLVTIAYIFVSLNCCCYSQINQSIEYIYGIVQSSNISICMRKRLESFCYEIGHRDLQLSCYRMFNLDRTIWNKV